jgi:hypothetical protein
MYVAIAMETEVDPEQDVFLLTSCMCRNGVEISCLLLLRFESSLFVDQGMSQVVN